jgi:tubulin-specific chaperone A
MGAIGYLTKPVTMDQIHEAFQTIEEEISKTIKHLLIVEDDEDTRFSMCELLKGDDVDITSAQTGEEAYTLLESKKFDCMVLDLGLEDISGMDLLEKIHEEARISHLPIIIYTGKELTKEEDLQLDKYAQSIIIKGVKSHERLLDEVTLFLHRVEADLPENQQKKLRMMHDKEAVLSDKTVLMVDDDMRNVFALSNVLEERGMHVLVAEHGKEALELLDQHPEIDIVLMDIMMPEMDGYEAMGHIRKQPTFKNLPIIALTAKAMKGDRQRCIDAGASDYLSKPVDTNKLLSLLRVWLY